ncbi:MAG: MATE family efflux transporter [Gemmataceae bacterium]
MSSKPDSGEDQVQNRVLSLAWPVLVQQYLILSVQLSDRYLAGNFLDEVAYQSAQTNAQYLGWTLACFTALVSVGTTALVARFIGAGDRSLAIKATNQSIFLAAIFGMAMTVVGLATVDSLIGVLQLKGQTADFAVGYLRPLLTLYPFQMIEVAGIACLVGAGDTRTGLFVLGGVAILNWPLAWGLMPALGFVGIAWGTALSHTLGACAVLLVLARGRAGLVWHVHGMRPDWRLIWRLLWVSVPAAADSMSLAAGQLWFLSIVNRLGDVASGAHGIAIGWEALGYLSGAAFGTAAMTLVGQNLGARRPDLAARSGWTAFAMGCTMMCLMGVVFYVLAPQMFALFCSSDKDAVVSAGVPVLRLVAFAMAPEACFIIFTYALRGAGDTRVPVLFTWVGLLGIRIPLAYYLTSDSLDLGRLGQWPGANLGLLGAWLAMFADLVVRGAFFLHRFAGGRWKRVEV